MSEIRRCDACKLEMPEDMRLCPRYFRQEDGGIGFGESVCLDCELTEREVISGEFSQRGHPYYLTFCVYSDNPGMLVWLGNQLQLVFALLGVATQPDAVHFTDPPPHPGPDCYHEW